jgi:hypothetical protein
MFLCSFIFRERRGKIGKTIGSEQSRAVNKNYIPNTPTSYFSRYKWYKRNISMKSMTYGGTFAATDGTYTLSLSLSSI